MNTTEQPVAIVTGASSGIGLGITQALLEHGWDIGYENRSNVITVYIHQAKTKNPVGRIEHLVLADGSVLRDSSGGGDGARGGGRGGRGQ